MEKVSAQLLEDSTEGTMFIITAGLALKFAK